MFFDQFVLTSSIPLPLFSLHLTRAFLALSEAAPESLLPRIVAITIGKSTWELLDANHRGASHSHELAANSLKLSNFGLSTVKLSNFG